MEKTAKSNTQWGVIIINLILALISVYLFEFWFEKVLELQPLQLTENIAIVILTVITYFIAKTYYIKGVMNTAKKILILALLAITILGLMLHASPVVEDVIYPFSGVLIVSVAFYMLSLSAGTLNTVGMIGLALLLAAPIAFLKWFNVIEWGMVADLSKFAVFIILFLGGTWAQIRAFIHGIRGTNADGGGFGDDNDGNGDTGSE
ncbi:MAG: hypothetical protein DRG24_05005 [Epsilonproteobacteria bacterium]|nr:MAG: hypothetical protein DRG24_05005 [Campylobacterota bacterium]